MLIRSYKTKVFISVVLSLLMLIDYAAFSPAPVQAKLNPKSVAVGAGVGIAGGVALAMGAPSLMAAIGSIGAAAGTVIAAVGGAVATVAGGIIGAAAGLISGVAGAIAAGIGWLASVLGPIIVPALIIAGVAYLGYRIYRHYKEKKLMKAAEVLPDSSEYQVTPSDYRIDDVMPEGGAPVLKDQGQIEVIALPGDVPAGQTPGEIVPDAPTTVNIPEETRPTETKTLAQAYNEYMAAYKAYTSMVTTRGGNNDPAAIAAAHKRYVDAKKAFDEIKAAQ
ncbi:MAG: hypothetical protein GX221_07740 [Candidatus Riflebacteria bacterium]|nr:hypothetical protein [Candidatus Riflebacteria bacterium]